MVDAVVDFREHGHEQDAPRSEARRADSVGFFWGGGNEHLRPN